MASLNSLIGGGSNFWKGIKKMKRMIVAEEELNNRQIAARKRSKIDKIVKAHKPEIIRILEKYAVGDFEIANITYNANKARLNLSTGIMIQLIPEGIPAYLNVIFTGEDIHMNYFTQERIPEYIEETALTELDEVCRGILAEIAEVN